MYVLLAVPRRRCAVVSSSLGSRVIDFAPRPARCPRASGCRSAGHAPLRQAVGLEARVHQQGAVRQEDPDRAHRAAATSSRATPGRRRQLAGSIASLAAPPAVEAARPQAAGRSDEHTAAHSRKLASAKLRHPGMSPASSTLYVARPASANATSRPGAPTPPGRDDDVLLPLVHVRHRRAERRLGHLVFPHHRAGFLVERAHEEFRRRQRQDRRAASAPDSRTAASSSPAARRSTGTCGSKHPAAADSDP